VPGLQLPRRCWSFSSRGNKPGGYAAGKAARKQACRLELLAAPARNRFPAASRFRLRSRVRFRASDEIFRNACLRRITLRVFQRSDNLFLGIRRTCEVLVALNAGVMQRFERVVALPNPKVLKFPAAATLFRNLDLKSSKCDRVTDNQPLPLHVRSESHRNPPNLRWCD
jgi:hypothetical protein